MGLDRERLLVARQRLHGALECRQCIAATVQRFGVVGPYRQCLLIGRERFFMTIHPVQDQAVIRQRSD